MPETPRDNKDENDGRTGMTGGAAPGATGAGPEGAARPREEGRATMPVRADAPPAADTPPSADGPGDERPPHGKTPDEGTRPPPAGGHDGGGRRSSPLGLLAFLGVIALGLSVYLLWQRIDIMTTERDAEVAAVETVEGSVRTSLAAFADEIERLEAAMVRGADPSEAIADVRAALESRLDAIESRLAEAGPRLAEIDSALEAVRAGATDAVDELRAEFGAAIERLARPAAEPADVERLLLMANDALILQRDVGTALAALSTADARLHQLEDPAYAETRRRIATEVAALEGLPRADVQGMAFALGGLQRELRALSPRLEPVTTRGADAGDPDAGGERTWRTFLGDLWGSLRGLVVIRRTDVQEGPLIAPEAQVFLAQNLYLELETARLALLERDPANFRQSLETARDWLVTYYDAASPRVAGLVERLDELARAELDPDLPDISGSLATLREAMEQRRAARRQATPPPPPAPVEPAAPVEAETPTASGSAEQAPGDVPDTRDEDGAASGAEASDGSVDGDGAAGADAPHADTEGGAPEDVPATDEGGEAAP